MADNQEQTRRLLFFLTQTLIPIVINEINDSIHLLVESEEDLMDDWMMVIAALSLRTRRPYSTRSYYFYDRVYNRYLENVRRLVVIHGD
jgi:membrane-bound lytic murein transglycosylase MltF